MIRSHGRGKKHLDKMTLRKSSSTLFFTREKKAIAIPAADASQHENVKHSYHQSLLVSVLPKLKSYGLLELRYCILQISQVMDFQNFSNVCSLIVPLLKSLPWHEESVPVTQILV